MPLQNRVTPFGDIISTPERGTMLGNRGILHNDKKEIIRTSQVRRWLICVLEFKGIRRTIMKPGSYTELFFLDEATALSAGHRPCCECRRNSYKDFQYHWRVAVNAENSADEMDKQLQFDRRLPGGKKKEYKALVKLLPSGTFINLHGQPWLILDNHILKWSPGGYIKSAAKPKGFVSVLTPKATVAVLTAGYKLTLHPSAGDFN